MTTYTVGLINGANSIEFVDFALESTPAGRVTVEISLCGICGTEVSSYRTGHLHSPGVCGHEWSGTIVEVGAGVEGRSVGQRVLVAVGPPCGTCVECRAGLPDYCTIPFSTARGRDADAPAHGGFARYITVGRDRVLPVIDGLTDAQAAQIEPASVAYHGIRRGIVNSGDVVAVQGVGPIGMLAMQFARAAGAGRIVVIEPSAFRRGIAAELGADEVVSPEEAAGTIDRLTNGRGADMTIEAAGIPALLQTAIDLTRSGGTVNLMSYISAPPTINAAKVMAKEIRLVGACAFTLDDVRAAMSQVAEGRVDVLRQVTRTVGLSELAQALDDLSAARTDDIKILVDPRL